MVAFAPLRLSLIDQVQIEALLFAIVWVFGPSQIHLLKFYPPKVMVLVGGPFESVHVVMVNLSWMLVSFKRGFREIPIPCHHVRIHWEVCDSKRALTGPCWHPDLRLPVFGTVSNEFLLFISHTVCDVLL